MTIVDANLVGRIAPTLTGEKSAPLADLSVTPQTSAAFARSMAEAGIKAEANSAIAGNSPLVQASAKPADPVHAARKAEGGDLILEGLSRLRGTFDRQISSINAGLADPDLSVNRMMAMQMEVAQFSLLVDVTSKLAGKTTQSIDTLMKGQ